MKEVTLELIETVIFWEKHTEIYDSLESIIRKKYRISSKDSEAKTQMDGVRFLLQTICEARIESPDKLRSIEPELTQKFIIEKINGAEEI
jgi:hypothetical protein